MKTKKRAGVTLLELIVAMSILTIAATPILAVLIAGISTSANTHRMNLASHAARYAMERLVGVPWEGPAAPIAHEVDNLANFYWGAGQRIVSGGQAFYAIAAPHVSTTGTGLPPANVSVPGPFTVDDPLLTVTVFVFARNPAPWDPTSPQPADNPALASLTSILNVAPGGFRD